MKHLKKVCANTLLSFRAGGISTFRKNNIFCSGGFGLTRNLEGLSISPPTPIISTFQSIAILTLLSFTIAEILNFCGIFRDENGMKGMEQKEKLKGYLSTFDDDLEMGFEQILKSTRIWLNSSRKRLFPLSKWWEKIKLLGRVYEILGPLGTIQYLSFKHQFAVG